MLNIQRRSVALLFVAALLGCAGQQVTPDDRISVVDGGEKFAITVAKSKVTLVLPKDDLRQNIDPGSGSMASPRYFLLTGASSGVSVSGWFEPAERRGDLRKSAKAGMDSLQKSGLGTPSDVSEIGSEDKRAILFNVVGPGRNSAHARCSYVQSGTWIDLHVSIAGNLPTAQLRAQLLSFLDSIAIEDKHV